jgi:hypothetical protein
VATSLRIGVYSFGAYPFTGEGDVESFLCRMSLRSTCERTFGISVPGERVVQRARTTDQTGNLQAVSVRIFEPRSGDDSLQGGRQ